MEDLSPSIDLVIDRVARSGRYHIDRALGAGGMASVYRGYDRRLETWRAIKVLHPHYAQRPSVRSRFVQEALALARVDHPNVVRVYDVDDTGELPFMVLELCDGGSVQGWLDAHGPMPTRLALDVLQQACLGVAAAHRAGIVHRDLKPDNLLLSREGRVQIADFGIAQLVERSQTRTGAVMGTWGYMAPEQASNAKVAGPGADIYALGATLYALATGEAPDALFQHEQAPEVLSKLPTRLVPLVARACRYQPVQRFQSADELARTCGALTAGLGPAPEGTPSLVTAKLTDLPMPPPAQPPTTSLSRAAATVVPSDTPAPTERAATGTPAPGRAAPLPYVMPERVVRTDDHRPSYLDDPTDEEDAASAPRGSGTPAPSGTLAPQSRSQSDDKSTGTPAPASTKEEVPLEGAAMLSEFVTQLILSFLKMVAKPLGVMAGPAIALGVIVFGMAAWGAADLRKIELESRAASMALEQQVVTDARLIDDLVALGSNEEALRAFYTEAQAPEPEARLRGTYRYIDQAETEFQRNRRNPPPEARHRLTLAAERIQRLTAARDQLDTLRGAWERKAEETRPRLAIRLGLASSPE